MFNSIMAAVALVQSPVDSASPLERELLALSAAPAQVRHEFVDQVIRDWNMPLWRFLQFSADQQRDMVERAYYIQALNKALLVHEGDPDLVNILNELADKSASPKQIALKFNGEYKRKFGLWAPIIPVNVVELTSRMLRARTVR